MEQLPQTNKSEFQPFIFKGNGLEYFRIWIVNVALSILTIGIYSAWAKVRTNRYIYANTYINNSNFEYNAEPKRILIGRLIVVGFYGIYIFVGEYLGLLNLSFALLGIFLLALPWLFRQAVCFKLRNTSYRHIPFRYSEKTGKFYQFFILHAILNIITFGLAIPYSYTKYKYLIISNTHYGSGNFNFYGKSSSVYWIFIKLFLWMIFVFVIAITPGIELIKSINFNEVDPRKLQEMFYSSKVFILIVISYFFIICATVIFKGMVDGYFSNYMRNNTTLQGSKLKGDISPVKLGWISVSNFVMIVLSISMLYPWAKMRYFRYKIEHTYIACHDYGQFESYGYKQGSTVGEEMTDFFDIDVGL